MGISLGGLERIDLAGFALGCDLHVGGKVTFAVFPLECGVWTSTAVPSRRKLRGAATSVALFHNGMASAAIKGATFLGHKRALHARFYSCTVHGNHPLSLSRSVIA